MWPLLTPGTGSVGPGLGTSVCADRIAVVLGLVGMLNSGLGPTSSTTNNNDNSRPGPQVLSRLLLLTTKSRMPEEVYSVDSVASLIKGIRL